MAITRKEFLKLGLVAGGAGLAPSSGASASPPGGRGNATTGDLLRSVVRLPKPFRVSLPVPAVLEPVHSADDVTLSGPLRDYAEGRQSGDPARPPDGNMGL